MAKHFRTDFEWSPYPLGRPVRGHVMKRLKSIGFLDISGPVHPNICRLAAGPSNWYELCRAVRAKVWLQHKYNDKVERSHIKTGVYFHSILKSINEGAPVARAQDLSPTGLYPHLLDPSHRTFSQNCVAERVFKAKLQRQEYSFGVNRKSLWRFGSGFREIWCTEDGGTREFPMPPPRRWYKGLLLP